MTAPDRAAAEHVRLHQAAGVRTSAADGLGDARGPASIDQLPPRTTHPARRVASSSRLRHTVATSSGSRDERAASRRQRRRLLLLVGGRDADHSGHADARRLDRRRARRAGVHRRRGQGLGQRRRLDQDAQARMLVELARVHLRADDRHHLHRRVPGKQLLDDAWRQPLPVRRAGGDEDAPPTRRLGPGRGRARRDHRGGQQRVGGAAEERARAVRRPGLARPARG